MMCLIYKAAMDKDHQSGNLECISKMKKNVIVCSVCQTIISKDLEGYCSDCLKPINEEVQ